MASWIRICYVPPSFPPPGGGGRRGVFSGHHPCPWSGGGCDPGNSNQKSVPSSSTMQRNLLHATAKVFCVCLAVVGDCGSYRLSWARKVVRIDIREGVSVGGR